MKSYDVIVLGLGGMGSSTALNLARRGAKVLGLEQFELAHSLGSSHGEKRMIRQAYFEHPDYVPLLKSAYKYWDDLCAESNQNLFHRTGLLLAGQNKSPLLAGAMASAAQHDIPVIKLSHTEIKNEYPQFILPESFDGVYEPGGGYLEIENCIKAYCKLAKDHGAELNFNETVKSWRVEGRQIKILTSRTEYTCEKLVIAAGPWSSSLLKDLSVPLQVKRATQFWFKVPKTFENYRSHFPCFRFDLPNGFFYGFPEENGLVKIAAHKPGEIVENPTKVNRSIRDEDFVEVSDFATRFFPASNPGPKEDPSVCTRSLPTRILL